MGVTEHPLCMSVSGWGVPGKEEEKIQVECGFERQAWALGPEFPFSSELFTDHSPLAC